MLNLKNTLNKRNLLLIFLVIAFVLLSVGYVISTQKVNSPQNISNKQTLILESLNGKKVNVNAEVALTPSEQEKGLMYRTSMNENDGMIFVFPEDAPRSFWMKNTLIPLDIIFFDSSGNLLNVAHAVPCPDNTICPTYESAGLAKYVLEVNANWTKNNFGDDRFILSSKL